ncbi:MAG: hypothetical protein KAU94_06205 [Verrucomicrobia bacterium]|nr:hypothetical protein [Verrucomicrobiota bacterium]
MKKTLIMSVLAGLAVAASADTVTVLNADFELGANPVADSWTRVDGAGVNSSPSCYAETVGGFGTGRNMHLKSDGGNYIQQLLVLSDAGVMDATTYNDFTIGMDYGQRQNGSDSNIRIALWNTTTGIELAGADQVITGAIETWILGSWNLTYNSSAQTFGDAIALRITNLDPDLGGDAWRNTASIDNVTVTAIPEPATMGLLAAFGGSILFIRRKLMM